MQSFSFEADWLSVGVRGSKQKERFDLIPQSKKHDFFYKVLPPSLNFSGLNLNNKDASVAMFGDFSPILRFWALPWLQGI